MNRNVGLKREKFLAAGEARMTIVCTIPGITEEIHMQRIFDWQMWVEGTYVFPAHISQSEEPKSSHYDSGAWHCENGWDFVAKLQPTTWETGWGFADIAESSGNNWGDWLRFCRPLWTSFRYRDNGRGFIAKLRSTATTWETGQGFTDSLHTSTVHWM